MDANVTHNPSMGEDLFSTDGEPQKDLRSLSAAIVSATERAELVAHETDRWLTGHQEFSNLDLVHALVSEAEGRLIQLRQMTVIQELDKFMDEITVNAPKEQAGQLNQLITSTKDTFSSAIESLEKFLQRSENIQRAYNKYKDSAFTLSKALTETSNTLQIISHHGDLSEVAYQVEAVRSSRGMLTRMKGCLRNMKDAMAGIESLTLTVCDLGMDNYVKEYKQRRAELSEALTRLENVQSQMERFSTLHDQCETNIAELNGALRQSVTDCKDIENFREQASQLQLQIQDMESVVDSLRGEGVKGQYERQLTSIKEGYSVLVDNLTAATSASYQSSLVGSPRGSSKSSPRRSPRRQTPSDLGTPRQGLRMWLRSKTDELQELMSQPFPFDDKSIQSFWHDIQKYQGDLVVKGEEFSLYASDGDGEQPTMTQITPLIDTCSDLSYRLDAHARLCVQYTADQNGLAAELKSLEEGKDSLQHSEIPLREQHRLCDDLLVQVSSLKRRVHDQLTNKLPAITVNLAKKEGGTILTDTSELDAAASKLKLEVKAFHQSLEVSISNLDLLTKKLTELHDASSQFGHSANNFAFTEPISCDNVKDALNSCKKQLAALSERQQYIGKLLNEKGVTIGRLPSPDNEELETTITQSTNTAEQTIQKLQQYQSNLTSLHQTVSRFDSRCDEAKERLRSAETLLDNTKPAPNIEKTEEVVTETVETITTLCKTRLQECVTYTEQAEIAVTEMEQRNNGRLEQQREAIKEIQAKHKALSAQLRDVEKQIAATADNQRTLDSLTHKFDEWLTTSQQTITDQISLKSGLNDMRDHIIKLHELEKSVDVAQGWLIEMKKVARVLSQTLTLTDHSSITQRINSRESNFELLKGTLAERIEVLSKEMEAVIAWVQKSSELVAKLHNAKHAMDDLSNKETDSQSIQWKLDALQTHIGAAQDLQTEFTQLTASIPQAVSEKQRKSSHNSHAACDAMLADLTVSYNNLSQVDKVWSEFTQLSGEVKGHIRRCQSQLEAVDVPGVSLDARKQRYEEICEALEQYPEGTSPQYLQELLSTCPIASSTLYSEAVSLTTEHEAILANAKKGAARFVKQLEARSSLEANLKSSMAKLKEISSRVEESLQLEEWTTNNCDKLTRQIQIEEMELKMLSDQIIPKITSEKEQHVANEETMTLDLRENIEEFDELHRDLTATLLQEKDVLVLAREFCQYIGESVDAVQGWTTQSECLCEDVSNGNVHADQVERRLQSALDEVAGTRQSLTRIQNYTEQTSSSLSKPAQKRLAELCTSLNDSVNTRETNLTQLLDHYGKLGQTKKLYTTLYTQIETLQNRLGSGIDMVEETKAASLTECQSKLAQIEVVEAEQAEVQTSIEKLYESTALLKSLLPPTAENTDYEQKVKSLCVDRWSGVRNKLRQVKNEASSTLQLFADVESRQQSIVGDEFETLKAEMKELESVDLSLASAVELEKLQQKACQNSAAVSNLWQDFLSAKEMESSLVSRIGAEVLRKSSTTDEIGSQLSSLATRCQVVEEDIEEATVHSQQACDSLQAKLSQMKHLESVIKRDDESTNSKDFERQQEDLQKLKHELTSLYQSANEVVSSFQQQPPPDVANVMNSIQNLNESLLEDVQQQLGQAEQVMEQWNVVHVMQQDLEKFVSNTMQAISSDIVDSQVALTQQRDLEEHVVEYNKKLSDFSTRSHDLESAMSPNHGQKLLESVSHFQKSFSGIQQGLNKRRSQVSELVMEEENFQKDLQQVTEIISTMNKLVRQEVSGVTLETCEQLANQYQEEVRAMPQLEQKLNDLVTLSIRLGDSSHHTDSTTKVLDLKKEWSGVKAQLSQQAVALKETTRLLLAAPQLTVTHEEWTDAQEKIKSEADNSLRDLHTKIDGSELMKTDQIMAQLKVYETEGSKLKNLTGKIEELNARKEQLQEASLDPVMLKDWAGQMMKLDTELKQLYMRSDETLRRQASIIEKAHKLAGEQLKRERMDDPVVPVPSQMLDLSLESDQFSEDISKTVVATLASSRPSLSQDEHAVRLFTVEISPEKLEAEEKMSRMISEHEDFQTSLADINQQIGQWQWTLDQDYNTADELKDSLASIQKAKIQLSNLSISETASQEPSLPVLSMSLETLELRCLSELQRLETNDSLTQDHRDTLDSIEEEVVACQKYIDYLDSVPGVAEEKLPGVEHKVSKLQRMFQTLKLINPSLCEGSLVSEYLGQLMNDLQVLQGRLEIIPEEGDFHSHGRDLHSWQEHITEHVNQHETDSDTEFVNRMVTDLSVSLRSLISPNPTKSTYSSRHTTESLSAYKELVSAAENGAQSGRLIDSEKVLDHKEDLQSLFTLFESYRLYLGGLALANPELRTTFSDLTAATQNLQMSLWCEAEQAGRLTEMTSLLSKQCDDMITTLTHLRSDYQANKINHTRLERTLTLSEPEYHGLIASVSEHVTHMVRCPQLKEKVRDLQSVWDSLQDLVNKPTDSTTDGGTAQLFSEILAVQKVSNKKLDLTSPLNICLAQALEMLVELDTVNWMYKDLNTDPDEIDIEIKSSILSIRPKMNAIRSDLQSRLRECSSSTANPIQKIYTWLGDVKPFKKQLPSIAAIHEYHQELLAYQCDLSQRSYITGLMMSLVTSCDHDIIVTSQNTVKTLHEAKLIASRQLSSAHSLRDCYKAFDETYKAFQSWTTDIQTLCKDCPIGSYKAVSWLAAKCQVLRSVGAKLSSEREEFIRRSQKLSSHELCSPAAIREINRQVKELLNQQEHSVGQLDLVIERVDSVCSDWKEFDVVYKESCAALDTKEHLLETVPCMSSGESLLEFQSHLRNLTSMLNDSDRQIDRLQPIAHSLRLSVSVINDLQALDVQMKHIKSREYKLYSQKLPLMIERWQKAQTNMGRYEQACESIRHILNDADKRLESHIVESADARTLELSISEYQHILHKLDTVDWSEVERYSSGVGQLSGIILCQIPNLKKAVDQARTRLVGLLAELTETCAKSSHCSQVAYNLENKLNRMERDPLLTSSYSKLSYKTLLDRKSKTEQLLQTLLAERQTIDNLESLTSCSASSLSNFVSERLSILDGRFHHILSLITTKQAKLQEEIIGHADINELQSGYQDWKNHVIKITSLQVVGEVKDFEDQRLKCLLYLNLADSLKLTLTAISKTSATSRDHDDLVKLLAAREAELNSLILKHKLFNRLKSMVVYSLSQLDSQLNLHDRTYSSHLELSEKVPKLKATFEQHQRTSLVMRQICQELLPYSVGSSKAALLATVQNASSKWQSVLSKLISQSDESMTVIANAKGFNHSLASLAKEVGLVRQVACGSLPEHHDHLQERQSQADVLEWRLQKINSKASVLKFDFSALEAQASNLIDIEICFNISQMLTNDSESMVGNLKQELSDHLTVWSDFMAEVNATLLRIQALEKLYMNEKRLTIEELLEEITSKYSLDLQKLATQSDALISKGKLLLTSTGELYRSAIQHGIVSLQSSMKHLIRLSTARITKLRDTMSAILEFESGMKSLNQWFKSTERSLNFTPADWEESTVLSSHQYLVQLEKDISHHSRTVTAVVNLCSLLQYDRDAGYDQAVRHELVAVKDRLNNRWKRLCDKIITNKDQLYEMRQAWSQMRTQTDSLVTHLSQYITKCEDYTRSKVIRPKAHLLEQFTSMLKECEEKHEDMRLLNNRHRYLIRQNMVDTSGCIKKAVGHCTELWDKAYQLLTALVKDMRGAHDMWTEFIKERDVLLAKISNLSLVLKTQPGSRVSVEQMLAKYRQEVEMLFGSPVAKLRSSCTSEEHRKLDQLIQELTMNMDTLRCELRPQDDLRFVEEELDQAIHQTEDIEHDLDTMPSEVQPMSTNPVADLLNSQQALQATGKVAEMERRVDEMVQRASFRRKLAPSISSSRTASNESLDSPSVTPTASQHQPLILSPMRSLRRTWDGNRSGGENSANSSSSPKLAVIGGKKPRLALIGSTLKSTDITLSCIAINKSVAVLSLPSPYKWNPNIEANPMPRNTNADDISFRRSSSVSSAPFHKYLTARQRSLSRDRSELNQDTRASQLARTRSVSLERRFDGERSSRNRTMSDHPSKSNNLLVPALSSRSPNRSPLQSQDNASPLRSQNKASPLRSQANASPLQSQDNSLSLRSQDNMSPMHTLFVDTSLGEYLLSVAPIRTLSMSPRGSSQTINVTTETSFEQQTLAERRQLQQDITRALEWVDKIEILHTSMWSTSVPNNTDLDELIQSCKQYNELLAQYHHINTLVMSINLVSDLDVSTKAQRDKLNTRWPETGKYLQSRRYQVVDAVISCPELKKETDGFCDAVTHAELKVLSRTHTTQGVQGEVRQTMVCVRSYISLLTSLLCESEGAGKQLLDSLRTCEVKCQNALF